MYRLFSRVPKGLEPVAEIFKKHVECEGMKLVSIVTEVHDRKKEKDKEKEGTLWLRWLLCLICVNLHLL